MKEIILDTTKLLTVSEPFEFITDSGQDESAVSEMKAVIADLKEILNNTNSIIAISAPQIGINKRVFCIKFNDVIKTFINPIVKRRSTEKFINVETQLDGESTVYICRPKEVEVTYFTDEFKVEDNKLLDQVAAIFMQQYNLLDGIVPGNILNEILVEKEFTENDLPQLIEATYSGSGLVFSKDDEVPELEEVANTLSTFIDNLFIAKLKDIIDNSTDENVKKLARQFWFEERIILGQTKIIDQAGWEAEKKAKRQMNLSKKKARSAEFLNIAKKASRR